MNRFVKVLGLLLFGFSTVKCSSSDSSGPSSAFSGAYQALKNNLPGSASAASVLGINTAPVGIGVRAAHSHFTNSDWPLVDGGSYTNTGAQYISSLVDESQDFSVLGRVKNSIMIACFLELFGTKDSSGQLAVGTQTVKMKRSWANTSCPGAAATMDYLFTNAPNIDSAGEIPLLMTITDISSGGVYERKITMLGADNPQFGGSDQDMRLGFNGRNIIFSHDEYTGVNNRMTSFLRYTASPEMIQFQLSSTDTNMDQVYRFYINDSTNAAALLAFSAISGGATIATVLTSKANDLSQGTVSQTYTNYNGSLDGTDQEGCINFDTSVFNANGFASCNGITGISSSGANSMLSTFQGLSASAMALTDTFDKTFDQTTITTQAVH